MQEGHINGWCDLGFLVRHILSMELIDSLQLIVLFKTCTQLFVLVPNEFDLSKNCAVSSHLLIIVLICDEYN